MAPPRLSYEERKSKAFREFYERIKEEKRQKKEAMQAARRALEEEEAALAIKVSVEIPTDEAPVAPEGAAIASGPDTSPPSENNTSSTDGSRSSDPTKPTRTDSESTSDSEPLFNRYRTDVTPASLRSRSLTPVEGDQTSQNAPALPSSSQNTRLVLLDPGSHSPLKKIPKKKISATTKKVEAGKSSRSDASGDKPKNQSLESDSPVLELTGPATKRTPPEWYDNIPTKRFKQPNNVPGARAKEVRLSQIKDFIAACKAGPSPIGLVELLDKIREELHLLAFMEVDELMVRKKQMLHNASGLPQIFDPAYSGGVEYPADIRSDALEQYVRWASRVFSVELLRGTVEITKKGRKIRCLEPGYPGRMLANYYGEGNLINGQWWPTQLCTVRDGAHGATQGGIFASQGKPAYSVVVAGGGGYKDVDEGEDIWYSGTDSKDGKVTENTASLIENVKNKVPVRVIRSQNGKNPTFRPTFGYRYDGVYDVLGFEVLDSRRQTYLFHLRRTPGQDPIRYKGLAKRPTAEEEHFYTMEREKYDE
ncbi:hypothetical protein K490DRAFT_54154 [Saccharata proteae CBS 121410]|uniref:YDG domain-containing protein n=1 Tax=Saccharata proteae CBS 121410 TaxID=1314787 RepID=A0A9P4I1Y7_9PEZI|nr:hypothetical protein K490DRAFT_54154 [Saccharata proteae CBS 121410]